MKAKLRIDHEGSRGWMWHLIAEDDRLGDILVGPDFLRWEQAEEHARDVIRRLKDHLQVIVLDDEHPWFSEKEKLLDQEDISKEESDWIQSEHPWNNDGEYEYPENSFLIDKSSGDYGWCAMLVLTGPRPIEAYTYYRSTKEEILETVDYLTKFIWEIENVEIEHG